MKLKCILLIDNSEIDNFVNATVVRNSGLVEEIVTYQSAAEGLDYLQSLITAQVPVPGMILLDLGMQLMDGFQFLDAFLKLPFGAAQEVKIVVVTSSIDDRDRLRAKSYPCVVKVLEKPLRADRFRSLFTLLQAV